MLKDLAFLFLQEFSCDIHRRKDFFSRDTSIFSWGVELWTATAREEFDQGFFMEAGVCDGVSNKLKVLPFPVNVQVRLIFLCLRLTNRRQPPRLASCSAGSKPYLY